MQNIDLLDVNVWLALVDENHTHHARARHYWETEASAHLAFSRTTALGLVRLLTNKTVMVGNPFTLSEAWAAYQAFRKLPEIVWLDEHNDLALQIDTALAEFVGLRGFTALHWTDGYLAALARAYQCRLVSFDNDFRRYQRLAFLHLN